MSKISTFSLPAGATCPKASLCLSTVKERKDGTRYLVDGKACEFRCFAASQEVMYTETYKARKHNLQTLKGARNKLRVLDNAVNGVDRDSLKFGKGNAKLDKNAKAKGLLKSKYKKIVRIHVSGDFFNKSYFDAWVDTARKNPDMLFYAYTKSVQFWIDHLPKTKASKPVSGIPGVPNLVLTASKGGKDDALIAKHNLRFAEVFQTETEARKAGLKVDQDDSLAMTPGKSFALVVHGVQPAKKK